ncbi:MAG: hypothetical protein FD143_3220 [Ignavibacteria bacterium]|nr:MAG: hypothetical protein FD143_3220 [Ignavibacteria bacterium]
MHMLLKIDYFPMYKIFEWIHTPFYSLDIYMCTLFTSILQAGAFSRFMRIENITQLDEPYHLRYYMPMFKRKSVKGKFSTIKMYGVGSLYSQ